MSKTKRVRFEEVASRRVDKVLSSMQSLQNCSNRYNYEYSAEDVKKMLSIIKVSFDELKVSFEKGIATNVWFSFIWNLICENKDVVNRIEIRMKMYFINIVYW